jgi:hypothetical protein
MIAAALVAAHPAPLGTAAANRSQGDGASDQQNMPATKAVTPTWDTIAMPNRRCASGRCATRMALIRKCMVMADEITETGQPRC